MSAAPKRPFWRFHLATTIILAVETGALIGLNVTPRQEGIRGWPENCIWWRDGQSTPYSYDERRIIIDACG